MRKARIAIVVSCLLCVVVLSGCHGSPMAKMKWVNPADADQTMEFRIPSHNAAVKLHEVFTGRRQQASYVIKKGDDVVESGMVTEESRAYLLKSKDGKEQRLEVEGSGSLKAENGTTWNLQDPPTTAATLHKL